MPGAQSRHIPPTEIVEMAGKAQCVQCHAVAGTANEMLSDFQNHVVGVPQIAPVFGVGTGNTVFDGRGRDEDFGAEQVSGNPVDRYAFRTSPLRNCAVQPAFFHNGCFTRLEDAVRHHLDVAQSANAYDASLAGVAADLTIVQGPTAPVLARLDPRLAAPIVLTDEEFAALVAFVREGLLDPRALPENLCGLVPASVPSGPWRSSKTASDPARVSRGSVAGAPGRPWRRRSAERPWAGAQIGRAGHR